MEGYENTFMPEECWALRRGYRHQVTQMHPGVACQHIKNFDIKKSSYFCIPLSAQNEIYGLLYLEFTPQTQELSIEYNMLVSAVAEAVALSIANVKLRELLRNQSIHDSLTNLYNRRFLDEYLSKQMIQARRQEQQLSVVMIDVDDFKNINDNHGHEIGDLVLIRISKILFSLIREDDVACRYGGEEFVVVLANCPLQNAIERAQKYCQEVAQVNPSDKLPPVTISLGVATFPKDGASVVELLESADRALYHAKNSGKNKVISFADLPQA